MDAPPDREDSVPFIRVAGYLESMGLNAPRVLEADPEAGAVFSNGRVVGEDLAPLGYTLWDSLWFTPRERARVRADREAEVFVRHVVAAGTEGRLRAARAASRRRAPCRRTSPRCPPATGARRRRCCRP